MKSLRPINVADPNVRAVPEGVNRRNPMRLAPLLYRFAYPLAAAMLVVWAWSTFLGPGWGVMHLLLTLGVSLLFWRIVSADRPPAA